MRRTKKFAIAILMVLMACLCMFGFTGCDGQYVGNRDQLEKDHVHSWGEYVVTTEATCEAPGEEMRTCANSKCGETETKVIPALGHDYGAAVVTTAPTCTAEGVETKTCARCGDTETVSVAKLNHDLSRVEAVEPTCVNAGNVAYYACAVCETTFEDPNGANILEADKLVVDALGHDDVKVATCTEAAVCSRCGTYGEALGHLEEEVKGYAATCTTDGLTDGVKCVRCHDDFWITKQEVIPAFGHTETKAATCEKPAYCGVCGNYYDKVREHKIITVEAKPATCEEDGYKAYSKCGYGDCNYTTEIETIPATGHINVTAVAEQPATCLEDGIAAYDLCACGKKVVNGVVKTDAELVIKALGHNDVTAATCTEKAVCSRCGEYGEALGHNVVVDDEVAATCTENGKKQWAHCTRCTYSIGGETIPALGHDEVDNAAKAATCTEIGWDAYKTCSRCDYSTKVEIAALGHTGNTVDAKAPTCTESGWAAYEYCQRCDYTTFKHVEALGHDEVAHDAQAATCTEIGWEAYVTCSRCDYTTYAEVAATGHTLKSTIYKEATCTATGNVAYKTCKACDGIFVYVDSVLTETTLDAVTIPMKPHNTATIGYKAATCTTDGHTAGEMCLDCDYKTVQAIKATGHSYVFAQEAVAPTCTEAGAVEYYTCANDEDCGKFVLEGENYVAYTGEVVIEALGHTFEKVAAKAPTCTEPGWNEFYACACNMTFTKVTETFFLAVEGEYTEGHVHCGLFAKDENGTAITWEEIYLAPLGHTEVEVAYKAATCTTDGNTAGVACAVCKTVLSGAEVIPASGHDYVLAQEAKDATCVEDGAVEYYTCANSEDCGKFVKEDDNYVAYTGEVVIPAKGHTLVYVEGIAPTCSANGVKSFYYCACQGEVKFVPVEFFGITTYIPTFVEDCEHVHCLAKFEDAEGTVAIDNITIAHLEHVWQTVGKLDPTCTEVGYEAGERCALCGETTGTGEIAALGHELVKTEATAETCEANGNIEYWTCSVCGNIYDEEDRFAVDDITLEDTIVDVDGKVGHTLVYVEGFDSTCTAYGVKSFYYCTCQGEVVFDEIDIFGYTIYMPKLDLNCGSEHVHCNKAFADAQGTQELTEISIAPKQHKWTAAVEHKAANCEDYGYYAANVCVWCQLTDVIEEIAPRGHELSKLIVEQPATCTEAGFKAHYVCVHEEVKDENGLVIYEACEQYFDADKNPVEKDSLVIPAHGHSLIAVEAKGPTCFGGGYKAFYVCADAISIELENLFDENGKAVVDAYTNTNIYTYVIKTIAYLNEKSVCGLFFADAEGTKAITLEDILVAHNEHVWDEKTLVVTTAPTCVDTGIGTIKCANCYAVNTEYVVDKLAEAHDWLRVDLKQATCTEDGYEIYDCQRACGVEAVKVTAENYEEFYAELYADDEEAKTAALADFVKYFIATGHLVWTEVYGVDDELTQPSCTETTYYPFSTCDACNAYKVIREDGDLVTEDGVKYMITTDTTATYRPATNHEGTLTATPAKDPTCTVPGNTAYWYCSLCNKYFSDEACANETTLDATVVKALGHTWSEEAAEDSLAPTCTEPGYNRFYCVNGCGEYNPVVVAAIAHKNAVHYVAVAPVCATMTNGNVEYWYCPDCGKYFSDATFTAETTLAETVVAWAHTPVDVSEEEAEEAGVEYIYEEATCYKYGKKTVKCSVCGKYEYATIAMKEHTKVYVEAKPDTCTEVGHNAYVYCTVEGCGYTTKVEIDEIEKHVYVPVDPSLIKDSTCSDVGYKAGAAICKNCGEANNADLVIAKKNHVATEENYVAAVASTCMAEGNVAYYNCANGCGAKFEDLECTKELEEVSIGMIAHNYVLVPEVAPKCGVDGVKAHYVCTNVIGQDGEGKDIVCPCQFLLNADGEYVKATAEDLKIEGLAHDTYKVPAKAPTCLEPGWNEYDQCANCEWSNLFENVIDPLKHNLIIPTEPEAEGEYAGLYKVTCSRCDYVVYLNAKQVNCEHSGKVYVPAVTDAKCGEYNNIAHYYCPDCQTYFNELGEIVTYNDIFTYVEHAWKHVVDEDGKPVSSACYECTNEGCDATKGHQITETGYGATHTSSGETHQKCSDCGYTYDAVIPAKPDYQDSNPADGNCDVCGADKEHCLGVKKDEE